MQQCVHLVDIETMLLQNEYLLANVASDTAENESSNNVCYKGFTIYTCNACIPVLQPSQQPAPPDPQQTP